MSCPTGDRGRKTRKQFRSKRSASEDADKRSGSTSGVGKLSTGSPSRPQISPKTNYSRRLPFRKFSSLQNYLFSSSASRNGFRHFQNRREAPKILVPPLVVTTMPNKQQEEEGDRCSPDFPTERDLSEGSEEPHSPPARPSLSRPPILKQRGVSESDSTLLPRPIFPNIPFSPYGSPTHRGGAQLIQGGGQAPEAPPLATPLGERLNQYRLDEDIGQGSFGIVKLAYDETNDVHYALKIMSKKKLKKKAGIFGRQAPRRQGSVTTMIEDPMQKIQREIAIHKKLDHPNVIKLIEVLDDPDHDDLYMVFELLEKGELLILPAQDPLPESRAWGYFRDVLLGLEYLHYNKIIHRDIKPSNLLLGDDGRVRVSDFGVCNLIAPGENDIFLSSTVGTPAFTPPEALSSKKTGDYSGKAADIYSLGVTLYCLVVGDIPFRDSNIVALYSKIQKQEPCFPSSLSPDLVDLLQGMITKDPVRRLTLRLIKEHRWVTQHGAYPLPSEEENCRQVTVSEEEVDTSVRIIPKIQTLILVKSMLKKHSFTNPFRGASLKDSGRSNSAPEYFDFFRNSRKLSLDTARHLPCLKEAEAPSS
ncbi:unnamed protein product [Cyprideis torosa]|uniref:Uncharacterized protein n=1 Tax=Cyprideis torosa TaxID=163714 RepID=A0A7R8ZI79_9CRUS|nr:unnamed protein product [Cyprideis torosa]CAG0885478.1 unnamed protein product [Cyprideis torosa]